MRGAALALALAALAALALSGCESSQEKSARLEKVAKAKAALVRAQSVPLADRVAHASSRVKVTSAVVVHGSEATAVVVMLHNSSAAAVRDVPIEIDVRGAGGAGLYSNAAPGLSPTLVTVPLVAPHASVAWVDDQVQTASAPATVSARVGEGKTLGGAIPAVAVSGRLTNDATSGAEVEGNAVNRSSVEQHELVIDGVALRAGRVVAAGRAVLPQAPAHSSSHFQIFFVGNPAGGRVALSAPATSVG